MLDTVPRLYKCYFQDLFWQTYLQNKQTIEVCLKFWFHFLDSLGEVSDGYTLQNFIVTILYSVQKYPYLFTCWRTVSWLSPNVSKIRSSLLIRRASGVGAPFPTELDALIVAIDMCNFQASILPFIPANSSRSLAHFLKFFDQVFWLGDNMHMVSRKQLLKWLRIRFYDWKSFWRPHLYR